MTKDEIMSKQQELTFSGSPDAVPSKASDWLSDCISGFGDSLSDEPMTDEEYERSILLSGNKGCWIPVPERIQTKRQFEAWVAVNDIDRGRIHDEDYINFLDWDWANAELSGESYQPPKIGRVLITRDLYSVDMLRANPEKVYVFDDNTQRCGKEGQSIIRYEPNALGIATKLKPYDLADSYFEDDNEEHWQIIKQDLEALRVLQLEGKDIVFSTSVLGTGLSRMPEFCPALFARMNKVLFNVFLIKNVWLSFPLPVVKS
jgi:hypothetical protein